MNCNVCDKALRRAPREGLADHLRSIVGSFPFRCPACEKRCYRFRTEQITLFVIIVTTSVCLVGLAIGILRLRRGAARPVAAEPQASLSVRLPGMPAPEGEDPGSPVVYVANILSNDDIAQMVQAKLGSEVVIRLIRGSAHRFRTDPGSLIELKKQGAHDDVIREMIEVTASYSPRLAPPAPNATLSTGEPVMMRAPSRGARSRTVFMR